MTEKFKQRALINSQIIKTREDVRTIPAKSWVMAELKLPALEIGYYSCEFSLTAEKHVSQKGLGIIVMPPRPDTRILRPFVGVSGFGDLYPLTARFWIHRMEIF